MKKSPSPSKDQSLEFVVSRLRDVAEFLGRPLATVKFWRQEGMPGDPGEYDLADIVRWQLARSNRNDDSSRDIEEWELRKKKAEALIKEKELEERTAALVPAESLESQLLRMATAFKGRLSSLVDTLAPQLEGLEERIRRSVLRETFADLLEAVAADYGAVASVLDAPPKTKPKTRRGRPKKRPV